MCELNMAAVVKNTQEGKTSVYMPHVSCLMSWSQVNDHDCIATSGNNKERSGCHVGDVCTSIYP